MKRHRNPPLALTISLSKVLYDDAYNNPSLTEKERDKRLDFADDFLAVVELALDVKIACIEAEEALMRRHAAL